MKIQLGRVPSITTKIPVDKKVTVECMSLNYFWFFQFRFKAVEYFEENRVEIDYIDILGSSDYSCEVLCCDKCSKQSCLIFDI